MLKKWFDLKPGWSNGLIETRKLERSYVDYFCDKKYLIRSGGIMTFRLGSEAIDFLNKEQHKPYDVFISYCQKENTHIAEKIELSLKEKGYNVWRDKDQLVPGSKQMVEITKAIDNSKLTLHLMSEGADESPYCAMEIGAASMSQNQNSSTMFVPVRVSDYLSKLFSSDIQYADCREDKFDKGIDSIEKTLRFKK